MSNTTRYGVLIDGRRGGYGVVFPDLPGCTAMGRTLDEALQHAMEAAGEWAQAVPAAAAAPAGGIARRRGVKAAFADDAVLALFRSTAAKA